MPPRSWSSWELGLKLSPDGEICPMCEEPTLTAEKRVTLQGRLKVAQDRLAGGRRLATDRDAALTVLTSATQAMDYVGIAGVDEEKRSTLQTLFTRNQEALAVFLIAHDDLKAAADEAASKSTALRRFLSSLSDRLADAQSAGGCGRQQERA